jgi:hypothetical protein
LAPRQHLPQPEHLPPGIERGVAADGMSVTWKLKTGVQWHYG